MTICSKVSRTSIEIQGTTVSALKKQKTKKVATASVEYASLGHRLWQRVFLGNWSHDFGCFFACVKVCALKCV